jgi:hypothetical protein
MEELTMRWTAMRSLRDWFLAAALPAIAFAASADAADVMRTKTVGPYRVELHVLPAEPFFTKEEVATKHIKEGMEIQSGGPVMMNAASHPNHHLVVHVFDKKSRQPLTDASVMMKFTPLGRRGNPTGAPVEVPVIVMQAIGKGPASTHYGNNVTMPAGRYLVTATVNGQTAVFNVTASNAPSMPTAHMKM